MRQAPTIQSKNVNYHKEIRSGQLNTIFAAGRSKLLADSANIQMKILLIYY
jgi:hypothetical protein